MTESTMEGTQFTLTVNDLERMFNVSDDTVRNWCSRNEIRHCRVKSVIRFSADDVGDFVERHLRGTEENRR
jgi:excisionase family DNA binding protein